MRIAFLLLLVALCALCAFAQSEVTLTEAPPPRAFELVLAYTGTNLVSVCYSPSVITTGNRALTRVSISAATNASPVVFTSTGHGFAISSRPSVTISGATVGWTAVNGTRVATIIDANTFSIPVDSTGFGALSGTLVFSTTAPRSTMYEWAVKKLAYDGSSNLIWTGWLAGSSSLTARCSDATSTTVAQQ